MLPVLAQGGAETRCRMSLCRSPEDPGKMGSTFLSRKEAAASQPLRGPRAHELPDWSRHRAGRGGAGWAASGQLLTRRGTAGAVINAEGARRSPELPHTAASSKASPLLPRTSGCCRPRGVELRGLQPGRCSPREKAPSPFKRTLQRFSSPGAPPQELSDTPTGAQP